MEAQIQAQKGSTQDWIQGKACYDEGFPCRIAAVLQIFQQEINQTLNATATAFVYKRQLKRAKAIFIIIRRVIKGEWWQRRSRFAVQTKTKLRQIQIVDRTSFNFFSFAPLEELPQPMKTSPHLANELGVENQRYFGLTLTTKSVNLCFT